MKNAHPYSCIYQKNRPYVSSGRLSQPSILPRKAERCVLQFSRTNCWVTVTLQNNWWPYDSKKSLQSHFIADVCNNRWRYIKASASIQKKAFRKATLLRNHLKRNYWFQNTVVINNVRFADHCEGSNFCWSADTMQQLHKCFFFPKFCQSVNTYPK